MVNSSYPPNPPLPSYHAKQWHMRLRWWIVKQLVGHRSVLMNCDVTAEGVRLRSDAAMVAHNHVHWPVDIEMENGTRYIDYSMRAYPHYY